MHALIHQLQTLELACTLVRLGDGLGPFDDPEDHLRAAILLVSTRAEAYVAALAHRLADGALHALPELLAELGHALAEEAQDNIALPSNAAEVLLARPVHAEPAPTLARVRVAA